MVAHALMSKQYVLMARGFDEADVSLEGLYQVVPYCCLSLLNKESSRKKKANDDSGSGGGNARDTIEPEGFMGDSFVDAEYAEKNEKEKEPAPSSRAATPAVARANAEKKNQHNELLTKSAFIT